MADTWALFDLNGTLVDPATMADPLGGEAAVPVVMGAFEEAIRAAMVTTMTGRTAVFRDLIAAALERALALDGRDPALAEAALAELARMRLFPGAAECLQTLTAGGLRVGVLTQSSVSAAEGVLDHSGLAPLVERVLSAEAAGVFKPDARVYRTGVEALGVSPGDTWMVAAHWWDIVGAGAAGMRTAWVSRDDRIWPGSEPAPDVAGTDLVAAAEAIVAAVSAGG